jgi:hypothetical protein
MSQFRKVKSGSVSELNSTTSAIISGGSWEGTWEDASDYDSVIVAPKTDQNGYFEVQFSPDGVNQDSTLTKQYRTNQIEAPHRYTVARSYCRVAFYNTSATTQSFMRLQTTFGTKADLNIPLDSTVAQDYDSSSVRPTDYHGEVALGRRQGVSLWNKFGYNTDVGTPTPEVIASWGGAFVPLTTATTLNIVSADAADDDGGTGCNSIVVYGIDENRDEAIEVVTMNGVTPVVTTSTWLGINRVAMFLCGSGQINAGQIDITATTGGSQMAQMPINGGVTQQCIFHIPRNYQFIAQWVWINILNRAKDAEVIIKMWVYSAVSNGKQEVFRVDIDTQVASGPVDINPKLPFPISGNTVMWLEAESDTAAISVNARFDGELVRDIDG